jgi:phosphocarrier protein
LKIRAKRQFAGREFYSNRKNWVKMLRQRLPIVNALGLHARAAARLVRLAVTFKCNMMLIREDTQLSANAKSILSVLHLAASFGTGLTIVADGEDENEAVSAVSELFESGFGEL